MKTKYLFIVFLSLILTGCGFFHKNNFDTTAPEKVIYVDPKLLQPCEPLPAPGTTYEELAVFDIQVIQLYGECKNQQEASILTIKKLANIKDSK